MEEKIKALEGAGYTVKNPDGLDFIVINKQGEILKISRENIDDHEIECILKYCEKEFKKVTR